jgi:5,10-methylenetetrahydrofolate reductase
MMIRSLRQVPVPLASLCRRWRRLATRATAATDQPLSLVTLLRAAAARHGRLGAVTVEHAPRVPWTSAAPLHTALKPIASVHTDLPGADAGPSLGHLPAEVAVHLPRAHVQAIAAHTRTEAELVARLRATSQLNPAGILCLSGDTRADTRSPATPALLRLAKRTVAAHISLAVVANPMVEPAHALQPKLDAGAEAVFTQPSVVPGRMGRWFEGAAPMLTDVPVLVGIACMTCVEDVSLWLRLVGCDSPTDAEAGALLATWRHATSMGPAHVEELAHKTLRLALEEAATLPVAGVHIMPVNRRGFDLGAHAGALPDAMRLA